VYTKASQLYVDVLKQQFSLNLNQPTQNTENNRPPRKRQATVIDYDSDQSEYPPLSTSTTNHPTSGSGNPTTMMAKASPATTTVNYDAEILSIKTELNSLRDIITSAVEQIKNAIASMPVIDPSTCEMKTPTSSQMEIEAEPPTATTPDLTALIADLKHDIATKLDISDLIVDLKTDLALIKSHPLFRNLPSLNQPIPVT